MARLWPKRFKKITVVWFVPLVAQSTHAYGMVQYENFFLDDINCKFYQLHEILFVCFSLFAIIQHRYRFAQTRNRSSQAFVSIVCRTKTKTANKARRLQHTLKWKRSAVALKQYEHTHSCFYRSACFPNHIISVNRVNLRHETSNSQAESVVSRMVWSIISILDVTPFDCPCLGVHLSRSAVAFLSCDPSILDECSGELYPTHVSSAVLRNSGTIQS